MIYFILSLSQNVTRYVAKDLQDLIQWFAKGNSHLYTSDLHKITNPYVHSADKYNNLLADVAMCVNDTKMVPKWNQYHEHHIPTFEQRDVMVIDELNRIIDPRVYWPEIAAYAIKYGSNKKKSHPYIYRHDPVPHTSGWRRGRYYRRPSTFQERKKSTDVEVQEYIRPKRNALHLVNSWDDIARIRDHSWKAKRVAKQWMKHLR